MSNPQIRADERGTAAVRARLRDDRGQAAVEFTGMMPIILITAVMLWQAALVGYTFSLAGNAADEAVRAGTAAYAPMRQQVCEEAGRKHLPDAWNANIDCYTDGDLYKAEVDLDVPLLFPGSVSIPIEIPGRSAAVKES
ncbi:septum formation initiator [Streptomyces camponoticapitis]|uniref:Septum formation initiator n=1 Tax=Streptomyces camponoticapitis TaxID=1616125 RepID=A0ABQ2EKA1_9ACTN|nr:TadE family protein [Streptomyces camponoticapitis]GGK15230.1 septum formation initiator [Streptomyces camponoticapitis]